MEPVKCTVEFEFFPLVPGQEAVWNSSVSVRGEGFHNNYAETIGEAFDQCRQSVILFAGRALQKSLETRKPTSNLRIVADGAKGRLQREFVGENGSDWRDIPLVNMPTLPERVETAE